MTGVPDLAEPIGAWRVWQVVVDDDGPHLQAPARATPWPARTATRADCLLGCDEPPSVYCACGLYALAHFPPWPDWGLRGLTVLGVTALWGRVIEATEGWRGERGYPLVLFLPTVQPDLGGLDDPWRARRAMRRPPDPSAWRSAETLGRPLAERYAVPVHLLRETVSDPLRWEPAVHGRASAVRDEATHGLASRRLGDPRAVDRFARSCEALLAALTA